MERTCEDFLFMVFVLSSGSKDVFLFAMASIAK